MTTRNVMEKQPEYKNEFCSDKIPTGKRNRLFLFFSILAIFLLTLNMIRMGMKKEGFMGDEQYTYHFICETDHPSITASRDGISYLNSWHTGDYYRDYFVITEDEKFDVAGTYNSIAKGDPHPPLYYILMEITCSLFSVNRFTKWSGIGFNLFFYLLTLFMLYKTADRITGERTAGLAACLIYSLTSGAISSVIFIRMYMMLAFAAVTFFYVHVMLWDKLNSPEEKPMGKAFAALFISALFGILTQYYFLIYAFFVCAFMALYLLIKKKWGFFMRYAGTMIAALITFAAVWPSVFTAVFSGYRGVEAMENLRESDFLSNLCAYIRIINDEIFGGFGIWFILLAVLSAVLYATQKRNGSFRDYRPLICIHLLVSAAAYAAMIAKIAPYQYGRYVFLIYPLLILLFIVSAYLPNRSLKGVIILHAVMILSLAAGACASQRYVSYLYPGTEENMAVLGENCDLPSVLVTFENRRYMSAAVSIYLSEASDIYPTDEEGIDSLGDVLEEHGITDNGFILYLDNHIENQEGALNRVLAACDMDDAQFLSDNEVSSVYIVRKTD